MLILILCAITYANFADLTIHLNGSQNRVEGMPFPEKDVLKITGLTRNKFYRFEFEMTNVDSNSFKLSPRDLMQDIEILASATPQSKFENLERYVYILEFTIKSPNTRALQFAVERVSPEKECYITFTHSMVEVEPDSIVKKPPRTRDDELRYSTVRIQAEDRLTSNGQTSTGCFFKDERGRIFILTNKHAVITPCKQGFFSDFRITFHKAVQTPAFNNSAYPMKDSFWCELSEAGIRSIYKGHPDHNVDLCALLFSGPLESHIKNGPYSPYFCCLQADMIKSDGELHTTTNVVNDVLMVGYPHGYWDSANSFPLFQKGITASHPADDFKNESLYEFTADGLGIIDATSIPGSSGSPIVIYPEKSIAIRHGGKAFGLERNINDMTFLGLLFYQSHQQIGFYVKAKKIPEVLSQFP